MMRILIILFALCGVARAQGELIDRNNVRTGTTPGTVAAGEALAAETQRATAAENSKVAMDNAGKVAAAALVNRPVITPITTAVGTTPTTVFPAKIPPDYYVRVRITLKDAGVQMACSGDGSTPVIGTIATNWSVGTSATAAAPGTYIFWDWADPPTGPIQCIASVPVTVGADAR